MKKYIAPFGLAILLLISGIIITHFVRNSLENLVNRKFPPLSYLDQQTKSLRNNNSALHSMTHPDASVSIGGRDLDMLLDSTLIQFTRHSQLKVPGIKAYRLTAFRANTQEQLIQLTTNFQLEFDASDIKIDGSLEGITTFYVKGDSLVLLPALKSVHVNNIDLGNGKMSDRSRLVDFINKTLVSFMENINRLINTKVLGIDINLMNAKIYSDNLPHNDTLSVSWSRPLSLSVRITAATCLIDEVGIHVMAKFWKTSPTAEQGIANFKEGYIKFKKAFTDLRDHTFPGLPSEDHTYFVASKHAMANTINEAVFNDTIRVSYNRDIIPAAINQDIVITSNDVNCDNIAFNCPEIPTPQLPSAPTLPGCNFGCKFWQQPGCGLLEAACRVAEAGTIAAWNATCESILVPWRTTNLGIQAACATTKATTQLSCLGIRKTIDLAGGKIDFGSVKVEANAHLKLNTELKMIKVSEDLSSISINVETIAVVPGHLDFNLHGKPAGKIVCPFDLNRPIDYIGTGRISSSINAKIGFKKTDAGGVSLSFEIDSFPIEAAITPSPLEIINGTFAPAFLTCPLISEVIGGVGITLNVVKGFRDIFNGGDGSEIQNLIFDGRYKAKTPVYPINIPIPTKQLSLSNNTIVMKALVNDGYLGVSN